MRRIVVIGSGGAGKSTFSRELASILNVPVFHLDKLFWKPNWVESSKEEFRARLAEIYPHPQWIMDGNFGGTLSERVEHADTVIFLDVSTVVCLASVVRRFATYRDTNRPDMTEGNKERLDWDFLMWILQYRRNNRPKVMSMLYRLEISKNVIVLENRKQMNEFLHRVSSGDIDDDR